MSRKVSQTNISFYFKQAVNQDVELHRNTHEITVITDKDGKCTRCITGICTGGSAEFVMQGEHRRLSKDQIFCIMPGHTVSIISLSPDFTTHYATISQPFVKDITSRFPNVMFECLIANPTMNMTQVAMDEAMRYFDLIESKMTEKGNLFQKDIIFNIMYSYTLDLYNMINRNLPNLPLGKTATESIFDRFTLIVHLHEKENRSVAFYADELNISAKHLSKVVKKIKGISAKQWLNEHLVFELKHLLVGTQMSIQEISDAYAFSSPDAMHHFFKKEVGLSPSDFRQQQLVRNNKTGN